MSLKAKKENLSEYNADVEYIEHHSKDSIVNLYKSLLSLTNELMDELESLTD